MNILLIDDDQSIRLHLRRPLSKRGHSIHEATDGKQAWETFVDDPNRFDAIITDLKMPVLDGVELLKRLREKEYDIPVIVITACEDIRSSIEVIRLGAFDFLLKPFTAPELLDVLEKLEAVQKDQKKQIEALPFFHEHITVSIPSNTALIPSVGAFLQNRIKLYCKLYKVNLRNVGLCLHEAIVNAIVHGNLEIPSSLKHEYPGKFESLLKKRENTPKYATRQVSVRCQVTREQLRLEIEDEGKGFNQADLSMVDPLKMLPSGRGILIITAFMDDVRWNEPGNCITMLKRFHPPL